MNIADRTLIEIKPYSDHPDDTHLSVVLYRINKGPSMPGQRIEGRWVTWLCNALDKPASTSEGHYFDNIVDAVADFAKRGHTQLSTRHDAEFNTNRPDVLDRIAKKENIERRLLETGRYAEVNVNPEGSITAKLSHREWGWVLVGDIDNFDQQGAFTN